MSTTKANFRLSVARRLGVVKSITTSSDGDASGNTFVAVGLLDNFPTDLAEIWVYDPTQLEARRIVNYDEPEGICLVNRPFSAQVASGATLYIFRRFSPENYDDALRQAVEDCYPYLAQKVVDTSLTTVANQYDYTIPATIKSMERMDGATVEIEVTPGKPYVELRLWDTRTVLTTSTQSYTLVLNPHEFLAGKTLRLTGLAPLAYPAADSDSLPIDAPQTTLLSLMVIKALYEQVQGAPGGDANAAAQREGKYLAEYERYKDAWGIVLDPTDLMPPIGGSRVDLPLAYNAEPS